MRMGTTTINGGTVNGGTGQVWVEGLLQGEKIYILMAWKGSGDMFADMDFIRFFASFSAF